MSDERIVRRHDSEWLAELEDRAAELVDRDRLLGIEREDWAQGRADLHAADMKARTVEADRWEAIKARSGQPSDYGWWRDSPWSDAL